MVRSRGESQTLLPPPVVGSGVGHLRPRPCISSQNPLLSFFLAFSGRSGGRLVHERPDPAPSRLLDPGQVWATILALLFALAPLHAQCQSTEERNVLIDFCQQLKPIPWLNSPNFTTSAYINTFLDCSTCVYKTDPGASGGYSLDCSQANVPKGLTCRLDGKGTGYTISAMYTPITFCL